MGTRSPQFCFYDSLSIDHQSLLDRMNQAASAHFISADDNIGRSVSVNFALRNLSEGNSPADDEVWVFVQVDLVKHLTDNSAPVLSSVRRFNHNFLVAFPEVALLGDTYGRYTAKLHSIKLLFTLGKENDYAL